MTINTTCKIYRVIINQVLLYICLVFYLPPAAGQASLFFQKLSEEQGLSQSSVTAILQDQYGFIWIGTRAGLNRYDGNQFKIFKHAENDSSSISNFTISDLCESRNGMIWVGTDGGGLNRFDPLTERFQVIKIPLMDSTIQFLNVSCVMEDHSGNLWIGSAADGLVRLSSTLDSASHWTSDENVQTSLPSNHVTALYEDKKGTIWIGTAEGGLSSWNPDLETFQTFEDRPEEGIPQYADAIFEDSHGILWVATWGTGLKQFNREKETFRIFMNEPDNFNSLPDNNVFTIIEDLEERVWVGTRNGLALFNHNNQRFQVFKHIETAPASLSNDVVFSLGLDHTGGLWVGTWGNGINVLPKKNQNFLHFVHNPADQNSLSSNLVTSIFQDSKNNIWIGTEGHGLNKLNLASQQFKRYYGTNSQMVKGVNEVQAILEDGSGNLWMGTFGSGLLRYTEQGFEQMLPDSLATTVIITIMEDSDGDLWLGTYNNGVILYSPGEGSPKSMKADPQDTFSLPSNEILAITEDNKNQIWIGTQDGLCLYHPETGDFQTFRNISGDSTSIGSNAVYTILIDKKDNLWVGTRGGGLQVANLKNHQFQTPLSFTKIRKNIPSPFEWVFGIEEDNQGNIWVNSGDGLVQIDQESQQITDYLFFSANQGAFYFNPNTGLMLMGMQGFLAFYPDSLKTEPVSAPVLISNMRRYNTQSSIPIEIDGIFAKQSITLDHRDKLLTFSFAKPSYDHPELNQFMYQLEGFDQHWIHLGTERTVSLSGLPPGHYTLHVKGSNSYGNWDTISRDLKIIITPPWYWSTIAKIGYFIILLTSLVIGYKWQTRVHRHKIARQKKELENEKLLNEKLKKVDQLKDQFLANTSHELRTPLQGIIGLSESLFENEDKVDKRENLAMIISSGRRLSNLVNDILDFSKIHHKEINLDLRPIDLKTLVDVIFTFLDPLIKDRSLHLINEIPINVPMVYADENRLQQILYNLIGNAIKFSEKGNITVSSQVKEDFLVISVADEGIGIPKEKLESIFLAFEQAEESLIRTYGGTGLGLTVSRQLVELHGGHLKVESTPGGGSTFIFTIPLSDEKKVKVAEKSFNFSSLDREIIEIEEHSTNADSGETIIPSVRKSQYKILIADDEVVNRKVLTNHLNEAGYEVIQANNGPEALERVSNADLILLDIMMPRMSGYEVCQRIRTTYSSSELPVVMLTAKNTAKDLVEGFNVGANDYLTKPFSKDELLSRIRTHLHLNTIHKATAKFVPQEFIQSVGRETITEVQLGDFIEKAVTVFFSDIREYTSLSEVLTPEENFRFVNEYVGHMGPIIQENQGFVNQYMGDGIMAIFPQTSDHALQASIKMQQKIQEYNLERQKNKNKPIKVGMGLHTGHLIMGMIGDKNRIEPATIADTVNAASRMEGLTKHYGARIILSEPTKQQLKQKELFHLRYLGKIKLKGKQNAIGTYECFDGDGEEQIDLKTESLALFNEGLKYFFLKKFPEAAVSFNKILKHNPSDKVADFFLKKSAKYTISGVPEDWDQIEAMETK